MATQLVALPEVERLSASVVRILGGNPGKFTLQGTNTYLIGCGHQRLLVDTGYGLPTWRSLLQSVLREEKATVHQALITHWHHDHANGVTDLLKICPEATVHKHRPDDGQLKIEDGQVFHVEGATLRAFYTPGHTVDHMAFIHEEEDAIFTGDTVLGHGTAVFEDLSTYLSSLQRMKGCVSGRAYPGHGAVIENATAKIAEYIKHREQREDEVMRVLRSGHLDISQNDGQASLERTQAWTLADLVKLIYRGVPEILHAAASRGVTQVLMKLEREGKVEQEKTTERWSLSGCNSSL
ncbi:Beta-lactamase-like protein [Elaphomyces granulatus]